MEHDLAPYCSLSPVALAERIAMIRREVLPHALASEPLPRGRAWRFPASPALRAKLEHLVVLERECCRDGVRFELTERGAESVLEVHGVDPNAEIFRSLGE